MQTLLYCCISLQTDISCEQNICSSYYKVRAEYACRNLRPIKSAFIGVMSTIWLWGLHCDVFLQEIMWHLRCESWSLVWEGAVSQVKLSALGAQHFSRSVCCSLCRVSTECSRTLYRSKRNRLVCGRMQMSGTIEQCSIGSAVWLGCQGFSLLPVVCSPTKQWLYVQWLYCHTLIRSPKHSQHWHHQEKDDSSLDHRASAAVIAN